MNAIERLIKPKSALYAELREELRGKARAYALERVGGSATNQRARTMLAAAFDHGVSAMVERARDALAEYEDETVIVTLTEEEREAIEALRNGTAKVIATPKRLADIATGVAGSAEPSDGALGARTGRLAAPDGGREGSLGVATDDFLIAQEEMESNEYRDHPGPFWNVGDCCVWKKRPELGLATIRWIGSNRKPVAARRCKLEYKMLDRVEDAYLDELEPVGER